MIPHFANILFCTDFSANADFAFPFACKAAMSNPGATLTLLHVIPEPDAQFWKGYIYEVGDMDAKARADIDQRIAEYRARLPPGLDLKVEMRIGDAARTILEYAEANAADLIVLGRQGGHRPLTQWLLGNVAGKVAQKSPCPVLIIPLEQSKK